MSLTHKSIFDFPRDSAEQTKAIQNYYRFQSKIYDFTRWTFLFGRNKLLKILPFNSEDSFKILEIGCGTGINLLKLSKLFPQAELTGIDLSADMIKIARNRFNRYDKIPALIESSYGLETTFKTKYNLILVSYALSMMNPQWKSVLQFIYNDLETNGKIAVVDFHTTRLNYYHAFMKANHVKLDGHLLPELKTLFKEDTLKIYSGLFGIWNYFLFIGTK